MSFHVIFGTEIIREIEYNEEYLREMPPEEYDVCDKKYTIWPKKALRSGSWDLQEFFQIFLPRMENRFNREQREAFQEKRSIISIFSLKEYIEDINNLGSVAPAGEECPGLYEDRVKWLKHWANKCQKLYGQDAKIEFL